MLTAISLECNFFFGWFHRFCGQPSISAKFRGGSSMTAGDRVNSRYCSRRVTNQWASVPSPFSFTPKLSGVCTTLGHIDGERSCWMFSSVQWAHENQTRLASTLVLYKLLLSDYSQRWAVDAAGDLFTSEGDPTLETRGELAFSWLAWSICMLQFLTFWL